MDADALIKRALLFLDDGEFDNARQYLNQALNQDAEDPRIHFGLLMIERNVHSPEELIESLTTPLEDEKLFQRAMRFAQGEYKSHLEFYAQASRKKLEQKRLAEEAELERIRLEQEAEKERRYQEILTLKDNANNIDELTQLMKLAEALKPYRDTEQICAEISEKISIEQEAERERRYQEMLVMKDSVASVDELTTLLNLVIMLRPYKDTDQIYAEVSSKLSLERKYQDVLRERENVSGIVNLQNIISNLEELNGYKDSDELLAQAKSALEDLEARTKRNWRILAELLVLAVVGTIAFPRFKEYLEEKAQTQRIDAMEAFFTERYDDAEKAINLITASADNPALSHIHALIKNRNQDGISQALSDNIAKISGSQNKAFYEATALAEKYTDLPPANVFLGDTCLFGLGRTQDTNKAVEYFRLPAEKGDSYSQFRLAEIYENDLNNYSAALKWYQKLADNGNAQAKNKVQELKKKMGSCAKARASQTAGYASAAVLFFVFCDIIRDSGMVRTWMRVPRREELLRGRKVFPHGR